MTLYNPYAYYIIISIIHHKHTFSEVPHFWFVFGWRCECCWLFRFISINSFPRGLIHFESTLSPHIQHIIITISSSSAWFLTAHFMGCTDTDIRRTHQRRNHIFPALYLLKRFYNGNSHKFNNRSKINTSPQTLSAIKAHCHVVDASWIFVTFGMQFWKRCPHLAYSN